ncbi:YolD-like family protein [Paenibacillus endoradicis]|uniref:YolD-like family protein n=1 Tax=Paenibacillus endoradicis TaxID=2972487 RepID=UPI0035902952
MNQKRDHEQKRRERIELDDQELDYIYDALLQSLRHSKSVSIRMFHSFEDLVIVGVVERLDRQIGCFKVDGEWFIMGDIEGAELFRTF